ncbi:ferroportin1 (FPN1) domain-containing protein [Trichoderma breve]|uniref:Solute carrier family 40 member n=1 Tax=Trichoderma breve TaxID=2034170 RepID=A0A9W9BEF4_9HYPO|nr:ferroportin1 (FPN1) domain-containing protein [Trichoderma breve]KAJ4858403.1 ferroportin1 (FPN1) domain-containing protein [Trichoderma breve]
MASVDEQTALLSLNDIHPAHDHVSASVARRLYVSHFLSTWNSRLFEFGAVLYLAAVFPGTLLPMSLYALVRGLSAIVFAPAVGWYIDTGNRLQVVRVSIVFQRIVVAASCAVFYVLAADIPLTSSIRAGLLAIVTFFACVEKLCSILNLVSVEKDWVVVVSERNPDALQVMNAQMRRIDLLCKLFGPLFIAMIDAQSSQVAMITNFAMNAATLPIEYFTIARVYFDIPELQRAKIPLQRSITSQEVPSRTSKTFYNTVYKPHPAFLPSIAGAVLYFTVLSFGGQMVTYLLSSGYSSMQIGIARTLGVTFEVLSTWAAPWLMGRIGPVRAGLWMSSWQVVMLVAGVCIFWEFDGKDSIIPASGLVGGTVLSRLGLRGFDLCVQLIVQEEVEAENRGVFSSVEAAWQNAFELLAFASTIVFSRPEEFKWPSLISTLAVASASSAYAAFVYLRRGHLLHLDALTSFLFTEKRRQRQRVDRITSGPEI